MGIAPASVSFLAFAKQAGVDFSLTVTIGRQGWHSSEQGTAAALREFGFGPPPARTHFAEPLFHHLGANSVDAIDASAFEGASIVQDMNVDLAPELRSRFTCVVDGGSAEHIFDVRTCFANLLDLPVVGGHLLAMVPANNQLGHGFYQFSPELYFRTLSPANGFEMMSAILVESRLGQRRWYEVTDPEVAGHRITVSTMGETELFVLARKTSDVGLISVPQQSDYAREWTGGNTSRATRSQRLRQTAFRVTRRLGPVLRDGRTAWGSASTTPGLKRVSLADLAGRVTTTRV